MKEHNLSRRDFLHLALAVPVAALGGCVVKKIETYSQVLPTLTPFRPAPTTEVPPTAEATSTPDTRTYFEKYVYPALYEVAKARRESKAESDPDFWHRVDGPLNTNRVNFVVLGKGSEGVLTDSMQIMSLDIINNQIRVIAVPRGVVAPEISAFRGEHRYYMANQAHVNGGMELTERMLEDATGLSCDFGILVDMQFLSRAVENLFGNSLEVCIPWDIYDVNMGNFRAGLQNLTGEEILRVSRARYYGTYFDRDVVQQYVLKAMLRRARSEVSAGALSASKFMANSVLFLQREQSQGNIETNFDTGVFIDIAGQLAKEVVTGGAGGEASGFGMPAFSARYEFSTENNWDSSDTTRRRPVGGNPQAQNLVGDYWFSSRREVRDFITGNIAGTGFEAEGEVCGISE